MSKTWMPILAGAMLLGASGAAVAMTHDAKSMDLAGNMVEGVMHMTPDARASIGVIGDHTLKQAHGRRRELEDLAEQRAEALFLRVVEHRVLVPGGG